MSTTVHIPIWLLSNVGGFLGLVVLSFTLFRYKRLRLERREAWRKKREEGRRFELEQDAKRAEQKRLEEEEFKEQKRLEEEKSKEQEKAKLRCVLPGPWKKLYDFLLGEKIACRETVLTTVSTFKRDVLDVESKVVPPLCPTGLEAILSVSYYNQPDGDSGRNCHAEVTNMLKEFVKFPS